MKRIFANRLGGLFLFAALYFAAGKLGLALSSVHPSATMVWPCTGLALAVLLLFGTEWWPAIALGAFLVNATTAGSLASSAGIAFGNTLEALLGALLVRRFAHGRALFQHPVSILRFILAGTVCSALSATIGVTSLALSGFMPSGHYGLVWSTWWLGDLISWIVLTPLLLVWIVKPFVRLTFKGIMEAFALLGVVILAGEIIFGGWLTSNRGHYPIAFLGVPVMVWAAFRFGQRGAVSAAALLASITVWKTIHGVGPFAAMGQQGSLFMMPAFVATITLTGLIVASLLAAQHRANAILRRQKEWLNIGLSAGRMGAWEWDVASGRMIWSPSLEAMHGFIPGTFGGTMDDFQKTIHPEDRAAVFEALGRTLRERTDCSVEYRIVRPDGKIVWVDARGRLLLGERDSERIVGVSIDVTHRKRSEQDAQRLAAIVESSEDAIIGETLEAIITSWNKGAERIFGYRADETIGRPIEMLIPPNQREEEKTFLERIKRGEWVRHYETVRLRKDGKTIHVSLTFSPVRDRRGNIIGTSKILRDITESKRAQDALQASERRFRQLTETVPSFVWTASPEGAITFASEQWYAFSGLTKRQLASSWITALHPDDRQRCAVQWQQCVERGEPYQVEVRHRRVDGQYRWLLSRAVPVRNEGGKIVEWFGVSTDITEQKDAQERTQASLQEKEMLLKEIHHRVKNNLQIIASLLNLQFGTVKDKDTLEAFKESQSRIRAMALVHEKLYSSTSLSSIDMGQYVKELAAQLMHLLAKPDIQFKVHSEDIRLGIDMAIPCGLILHELLSNALKHAFPKGRGGRISVMFAKAEGDVLVLVVEDDGIGMPESVSLQNASSLGLQLVRMLAEQVNGTVELSRHAGTRFSIRFSVRAVPKLNRRPLAQTHPTTNILIVEDEQIIAMDLRARLRRLGYSVSAIVSTGRAAIEHARALDPGIVLMDMGLAGEMDGVEAAQRIRAELGTPVVFITAHADGPSRARASAVEPAGYILKPFNETELKRALGNALGAPTMKAG